MNKNKKVYIIILNYLKWEDTIECLETILRNNYSDYQVILIDNNSPNNSVEYIKNWMEGKLNVLVNPNHPLRKLSFPPLKKPIPYVMYSQKEAEKGGDTNIEKKIYENFLISNTYGKTFTSKYPIIIIKADENKGYSAGNNIGIKYALAKDDFEYIWLLNNDTVIKKDTLTNLIHCAENLDENISPIGTILLYYDKPNKIQTLGAKFNKFYALGRHLKKNQELEEGLEDFSINQVDYVVGASMLLRKNFIRDVGLLDEDYFIYFEEIDICERGIKKGYKLYICINSIVYHKEGTTMENLKSELSDFFAMRNRIIFTKKNNSFYLPFVYLSFIVSLYKRIKRKEFKKAYNIIKIIFGKRFL